MPVSIVVGGQFGSEGKGKVAHYLADKLEAKYVVRCGGPNSGHTVIDDSGKPHIFQQLPTASILPKPKLAICAGSYIDLDILLREIAETEVGPERLIIDPDAVIITEDLKRREVRGGLIESIGSTGSGTGAAVGARTNRGNIIRANDVEELQPYINDVSDILRKSLDLNERVLVEGTQGFGLSPLHSKLYPFCTSRDTTAASFLAETGLSPFDVDEIILTIRAFPIRVAGNSGPLPDEINWEMVSKESGCTNEIIERTTVTKNTRRVARFSADIVKKAIVANRPSKIVINHIDYIHEAKRIDFIREVEFLLGGKVSLIGLSPSVLVDRDPYIELDRY